MSAVGARRQRVPMLCQPLPGGSNQGAPPHPTTLPPDPPPLLPVVTRRVGLSLQRASGPFGVLVTTAPCPRVPTPSHSAVLLFQASVFTGDLIDAMLAGDRYDIGIQFAKCAGLAVAGTILLVLSAYMVRVRGDGAPHAGVEWFDGASVCWYPEILCASGLRALGSPTHTLT